MPCPLEYIDVPQTLFKLVLEIFASNDFLEIPSKVRTLINKLTILVNKVNYFAVITELQRNFVAIILQIGITSPTQEGRLIGAEYKLGLPARSLPPAPFLLLEHYSFSFFCLI